MATEMESFLDFPVPVLWPFLEAMCNLGQNTTVAYNSLEGVAGGDSGEGPTSLPISSLMRECQQSSPAVLTFLAETAVWFGGLCCPTVGTGSQGGPCRGSLPEELVGGVHRGSGMEEVFLELGDLGLSSDKMDRDQGLCLVRLSRQGYHETALPGVGQEPS